MKPGNRFLWLCLVLMVGIVNGAWAGKQRILVRLREPLRAESVKIRLPEVKNTRGETRDLETVLDLKGAEKKESVKTESPTLKLDMSLRPIGREAVQVTLTLPTAGFVEILVLDFYGKNLATLAEGHMTPGVHVMPPFVYQDGDHNGIQFLTLRIGGKVAMKRVMTKVR